MANLVPQNEWSDVRQLEKTDVAIAGPNGTMNEQAQALLNRTEHINLNKADNRSIAVKFLLANEIGLTKWTEFTKPPYTTQQYEQAYNNGVNLAIAVKEAYAAGYSKVILERGKYPFCYQNLTGSSLANNVTSNCILDGLDNFELDFNNSSLFVIFDSNNRSPYDLGTTLAPYQLPGAMIMFKNNTNLTVKRAFIRGDQYMRTWVTNENNTEQTYGFNILDNNINIKFEELSFTGFRGDGISGSPKGASVGSLDVWYSGGVDASGNDIVEVGSYRSGKLDLNGKTILRNAVQINTTGYLRSADFRNDQLAVFFYDTNGVFQSSEKCYQTEFVYLPKNCRYVQFVAFNDERTDATVGYGNWVFLASGNSDGALINRCKFYENHRGGISNLCANTTINDCDFYDNGGGKQGFPNYGDVTRYAINFEDSYVTRLTVTNCRINNHVQAILCNARYLFVANNKITNIKFSGTSCYGTFYTVVTGNTFNDVGALFSISSASTYKKRMVTFSNNNIMRSELYGDMSSINNLFVNISNNIFLESRVSLIGNGQNLVFNNNTLKEISRYYVDVFVVKNALSAVGNVALRNNPKLKGEFAYAGLNATLSDNNYLYLTYSDLSVNRAAAVGESIGINGLTIESLSKTFALTLRAKTTGWETHVDNIFATYCTFKSTILGIGKADFTITAFVDMQAKINNCTFTNGAYASYTRTNETQSTSSATIVFESCVFDLTDGTKVFNISHQLSGTLTVTFINCTFKSSTVKSLQLVSGALSNVTSKLINCKLVNVTNTDTITTVQGQAKVTYDPQSLAAGAVQSTTVTLAGAVVGDAVVCSFSLALNGTRMWAEVTAANTVTVYHQNTTSGAVDIGSGTLTVKLI